MIKYFTKSRIIYYTGIALSVLAMLGLCFYNIFRDWAQFQSILLGPPLVLVLGLFLSIKIAGRVAVREDGRLLRLLTEECDPEAFVTVYAPYTYNKKVLAENRAHTLINLSTGYIELGDDPRAVQTLLSAIHIESAPRDTLLNGYTYCNLAAASYNLGRMEDTAQYLQNAGLALGRLQKAPKLTADLSVLVTRQQVRLFPRDIGYSNEDCIRFWEQQLPDPKNSTFSRVQFHKILAKLCAKAGDAQKAIEHCRYVLEHGNKLRCVPEAKSLLSELEKSC